MDQPIPLLQMTPDQIREEINSLRERRLVARQQSIDENKPKEKVIKEKIVRIKGKRGAVETMDKEMSSLLDNLLGGSEQAKANLDQMFKNMENL